MKDILTYPLAALVAVSLFFAGSGLLAFANVAYGADEWHVHINEDGEAFLREDGETVEDYGPVNEVQVIAELAAEHDMIWSDAAEMTMFSYADVPYDEFDSNEDEYSIMVMVNEEGFALATIVVNGESDTYWFKTRNVSHAIDMLAEIYHVPENKFREALTDNDYAAVPAVQVQSSEEDNTSVVVTTYNEDISLPSTGETTFYVYQGAGQSAIMAYRAGALDESYYYESDNRSEIVAQLALRYGMTESEVVANATFESDGVDDVDLENRMGRDDGLDPHEGDNTGGDQTPVQGY